MSENSKELERAVKNVALCRSNHPFFGHVMGALSIILIQHVEVPISQKCRGPWVRNGYCGDSTHPELDPLSELSWYSAIWTLQNLPEVIGNAFVLCFLVLFWRRNRLTRSL